MNRIFLTGFMGSGKSTIGKMLASHLRFSFIDLDTYIESKFHKTIAQIFTEIGEQKFRQIEQKCLHEVAECENTVIATGGGTPCFFDNMEFMNLHGITVYIKLNATQLASRLEDSPHGKRPLLAERIEKDLHRFIENGLTKRESYYMQSGCVVDGFRTPEELVSCIVELI
ncbi:MAG: shikimate kinase [Paludibacter sp.]|nr:shikimate kinase [Paludibacter sp.]